MINTRIENPHIFFWHLDENFASIIQVRASVFLPFFAIFTGFFPKQEKYRHFFIFLPAMRGAEIANRDMGILVGAQDANLQFFLFALLRTQSAFFGVR